MFISGYQSDDAGTREDEAVNPVRAELVMEAFKEGFGQVQAREGITIRYPASNPGIRGVGKRFPTASSGLGQLCQNVKLSQTP